MRVLAIFVLVVVAFGACKKRPKHDQSSPEKALDAFFTALNKERFPGDLEHYVSNPKELQLWRFRCKQVGCTEGTYKIVSRGEVTAYRAMFNVDYVVRGKWEQQVTSGTNTPVIVEREEDKWYIARFGDVPAEVPPAESESTQVDAAAGDPPPPPSDAN
jgi:hypothetical protein